MTYTDELHSLLIADSEHDPLAGPLPSFEAIEEAYRRMIISSSGWRTVFAASGDEEDATDAVRAEHLILTALAAVAFYDELAIAKPTVLVGLDARPTGRILGSVVVRTLLGLGSSVRYLFITAAPQIMAFSHQDGCDGFFYISASHNPIGHNGFKMGSGGGVYSSERAQALASRYAHLVADLQGSIDRLVALRSFFDSTAFGKTLEAVDSERRQSSDFYRRFILQTAFYSKSEAVIETALRSLKSQVAGRPLGIVAELNGSARSTSIDEELLRALGVSVALYNNRPGMVVHPIVPEGENLDLCRTLLEQHYRSDRSFILGYSVDNDGDRGNIVYIDEKTRTAKILDAQSVYALCVLSELAQSRLADPNGKLATVVNGPTSMRIDAIAHAFGASVFRCEVGEANVVALADAKRSEGWHVPILGEGSNGGNITHPARVRDPLNTLVSLVQLLRNPQVAELWYTARASDVPAHYSIGDLIESLPPFITTGAFSPSALMKITTPHRLLKARYEEAFVRQWEQRRSELAKLGFVSWRIYQTEGTVCRQGLGEAYRTPPYSGGYKVALSAEDGEERAFLWMRGSKTEPVFRVMVDLAGSDHKTYDYLLEWHRGLIEEAASASVL